jgi:hypothetical protein
MLSVKITRPVLFLFVVLLPTRPVHAGNARAINDVIQSASVRDKVLIEGRVKRAFDFDTYLVSDDKSEIAVSFLGVRQNLKVGDAIAVYGRFRGRASYKTTYALLEALEWTMQSDPKAVGLRDKYGVSDSTATASAPPCILPLPTIESRLKQLEDLKAKKLISNEEYQQQRKRILNDL